MWPRKKPGQSLRGPLLLEIIPVLSLVSILCWPQTQTETHVVNYKK